MKNNLLFLILLSICNTAIAQYSFNQIDIWTGSSSSSPRYLTNYNGDLYFQASEITPSFKKLYKSNGTEVGTSIIATNLNGGAGYSPESLTVFNNELYFTAFVSGLGIELYKTDGTDAGTELLKDVRVGGSGGLDQNTNNDKALFVEFNGELYFRGNTSSSIELWKTDGTQVGTVSVKNFESTTNGAPQYTGDTDDIQKIGIVYNNELYFAVNRGGFFELWKTDGTTLGTSSLKTDFEAPISNFIIYNNELLFTSSDVLDGIEIWKTDGTVSGTQIKHDIFPNDLNPALGKGSNPEDFLIYQSELFFTARSYNSTSATLRGRELYKSNGTVATLVKEIKSGIDGGLPGLPRFTLFNNELFFLAEDDTTTDLELWKTDGTEVGTIKLVTSINTGEAFQFRKPIEYNGKLLYHNFQQIWVTDGTPSGTIQLTNNGGAGSDILLTQSGDLINYDNKIWFTGYGSTIGNELTNIEDTTLSINEVETTPLSASIYPNPVKDVLYINTTLEIIEVEIYSLIGRQVLKSNRDMVNVSYLQAGSYIVKVKTPKGSVVAKFIKN